MPELPIGQNCSLVQSGFSQDSTRSKQFCHPPLPATANAHSSLRSCKLWSLMIVTHRITITLLSDVLGQAVLVLSCWTCSCGGVTKPWGGGGYPVRGTFHTPFHLLCSTARDGLMQLSIQFIEASAAILCLATLSQAFEVCYYQLGNHKCSFCLLQGLFSR